MNFIKNKKIFFCLFVFLFSCFFVLSFNSVWAAGATTSPANRALLEDSKIEYSKGCISSGNCELDDFIKIALRASEIILGLVGSLALVAFVIGGVMFLVSGGNQEKVARGKQIIVGAVVGLAIVFASYLIIQFAYKAMGLKWEGKAVFPSAQNSKL